MHKKALVACMALLAFAAMAVVPALASATPVLKNDAATPANVAVGAHITGFSSNLTVHNGAKKIACTENHIVGTLRENTGTMIGGEIESEVTGTKTAFTGTSGATCATEGLGAGVTASIIPMNLPWCLTSSATVADEWTLKGGACPGGAGAIVFEAKLTTGAEMTEVGHCLFSAAEVKGTYNTPTTPTAEKLTVTPTSFTKQAGSSVICPATITLEGDFSLAEETTGMAITPLMIS